MDKVISFVKKAVAFVVGLNYWGLALVGWAALAYILGFPVIAIGLLCFFAGKNAQSIKQDLKSIKW